MNNLKEIMKEKNISTVELTIKTGLSDSLLDAIRNGYNPTISTQRKIAEVLGVSVERIFPPSNERKMVEERTERKRKSRLHEIMTEKGIDLTELMCKTAISYSKLHLIRHGYIPSPKNQEKIANALGVSIEELFPEVD